MLENFKPPYESTATARLKEAGYVLLEKPIWMSLRAGLQLKALFGTSLNPWNKDVCWR
jgi:Asp-tRNA(Asn)/Glu-tRNA(Gln) amidotransferase A subunit family amidase